LVEQGAHDGQFAHDVLHAASTGHSEFFAALRYAVVEPFEVLRERQAATLVEFREKLTWHDALGQLPPFTGVHFSNELIDAMPVHLVKWTGSEWLERHVGLRGDEFVLIDQPLSDLRLDRHLHAITTPLPAGYETEVNLAALSWIDGVASRLERGYVMAVDYGLPRDEFYAPHRTSGTLRSYAEHRTLPDPFAGIGTADITAHVEWTSLAEAAIASGLRLAAFTDQHHFLTGLLTEELARELERDPKTARALQTLLHPGFLGMKFQFLVLAKNVHPLPPLRGLRFARDAARALGLSVAADALA
ncbi:MAG TPA: SAM-dependent methyltransferase, partial [Chthoniobacterales bacterium]